MTKIKSDLEKMLEQSTKEAMKKDLYQKAKSLAMTFGEFSLKKYQIGYIITSVSEWCYNPNGLLIKVSIAKSYSNNFELGSSENILVQKNNLVVYCARGEPFRWINLFRGIPVGKIGEYVPGSWTEELKELYNNMDKKSYKKIKTCQ